MVYGDSRLSISGPDALSVTLGVVTATLALAVMVPPVPVAVAVYFVVADGVTETLPDAPNVVPDN
jgi:hypothetical protein